MVKQRNCSTDPNLDEVSMPDAQKRLYRRLSELGIEARILMVADVYDAITSERPYRQPMSEEDALRHIESRSGTHFDPQAVAAFLHLRDVTRTAS